MNFTEFVQWYFKDENSGATTVLVLFLAGVFIIKVIRAIKGEE